MITIEDLKEHCEKQLERLPKISKMYEEHLLTLNIINELQQKDKQIDLMIEEYEYNDRINFKDFCEDELRKDKCIQDCKICVKQYFETKAKGEYYD